MTTMLIRALRKSGLLVESERIDNTEDMERATDSLNLEGGANKKERKLLKNKKGLEEGRPWAALFIVIG